METQPHVEDASDEYEARLAAQQALKAKQAAALGKITNLIR